MLLDLRRSGFASFALRLSGLGGRLVLSLYIARFIGLEGVAIYGFVVGASSISIALTGLGLDARIGRRMSHASRRLVGRMLRDRLVLRSLIALPLLSAIALWLFRQEGGASIGVIGLVLPILYLEPFVYDLQMGCVYRGSAVRANLILFVRAAGWVPVVMLLGWLFPDLRSIEVVLLGWLAGLLCCLAMALRPGRADGRSVLAAPVRWSRLAFDVRASRLIYVSELGFVGMVFANRYLVAALLDVEAAGRFVLLWSFSNAVVPLVQAAVFNSVLPDLLALWRRGRRHEWLAVLQRGERATLRLSLGLAMAVLSGSVLLLWLGGLSVGVDDLALLVLMLTATVVRLQADLLQNAFYSQRGGVEWAAVNCIVTFGSMPMAAVCIAGFGIMGAGLEMLITATLLLSLRTRFLSLALTRAMAREASARTAPPQAAEATASRATAPS